MGLFEMNRVKQSIFIFFFAVSTFLTAAPGNDLTNRVLYLIQTGNTSQALQLYRKHYEETKHHDFELIQQIGLILLDQGFRTRDPEVQLLTLFGAGISTNEKVLYILEEGLNSNVPQLQLISLNFLARYQNDNADYALNRAMASNFILIRLEAAFHLCQKKYPTAVGQTEALMQKLPGEAASVFPQLFALVGTEDALKVLRRLMSHPDIQVRVESILSAAKHGRDDLLPRIRTLAKHHGPAQQEACAFALGVLKDEASFERLQTLASSPTPSVALAALQALYRLGKKEAATGIMKMAKEQNLFAIEALGEIAGSEQLLFELTKNGNMHVKANAALALLERRDPRCLTALCEVLIKDSRDVIFTRIGTIGKSLSAWRAVPSAKQNLQDNPVLFEMSLSMREAALTKALELPEKDFLNLAYTLFELQQNDLVPVLVDLLENKQTPGCIELLKKYQQKAGAPLIRNYCNLALYRLKETGPYDVLLREWVAKQHDKDFIRFRPVIPWELRESTFSYHLTPEETSRLLVESFETLAQSQDEKDVNVLLDAIENGNPKNKYALAGLLLRATQ